MWNYTVMRKSKHENILETSHTLQWNWRKTHTQNSSVVRWFCSGRLSHFILVKCFRMSAHCECYSQNLFVSLRIITFFIWMHTHIHSTHTEGYAVIAFYIWCAAFPEVINFNQFWFSRLCECECERAWKHQAMLKAAALDDDDDDDEDLLLVLLSLVVQHSHMRDVVCNSMRSYYRTASRPSQTKREEKM